MHLRFLGQIYRPEQSDVTPEEIGTYEGQFLGQPVQRRILRAKGSRVIGKRTYRGVNY